MDVAIVGIILPIVLAVVGAYVGSQEVRLIRQRTGDNSWLMRLLSLRP